MSETVLIGEAESGRSAKVKNQLENLISSLTRSTFDLADLLYEVKSKAYFVSWGFTTFQDYVNTLDIKARKSQYLTRIVEVMDNVGVEREVYEPLGVAKLREITSLNVDEIYTNPQTGSKTPMSEFVTGFVERGAEMSLDEIKQHVRTLKGKVGDNEEVWLNIPVAKAILEQTIRPALELAKANIGSVAKDDEGISKDANDSYALEVISAAYLIDPVNEPFKTE